MALSESPAEPLPTVRSPESLRAQVRAWRAEGRRIAFVPTMGALHAGHLSLVAEGLARADVVVASVFVNPAQFAPGEDFDAYPRQEAEDARLLADAGCALLYAPPVEAMYPPGEATVVRVSGPAEGLESEARPHFFTGVATVVAKLFAHVSPDVAVFGEKDYQQLLVVRRMARDLGFGVEVVGAPTQRDPDGLALSSRNAYLTPAARKTAPALYAALQEASNAVARGEDVGAIEHAAATAVLKAGFESVDYVAVRDAATLAPLPAGPARSPARILAAARLAGVRLIDNVPARAAA